MTPTEQCFFTGHLEHSGPLGEQIVAPSSMTAWLKSPGLVGETILLALLQKALKVWLKWRQLKSLQCKKTLYCIYRGSSLFTVSLFTDSQLTVCKFFPRFRVLVLKCSSIFTDFHFSRFFSFPPKSASSEDPLYNRKRFRVFKNKLVWITNQFLS